MKGRAQWVDQGQTRVSETHPWRGDLKQGGGESRRLRTGVLGTMLS